MKRRCCSGYGILTWFVTILGAIISLLVGFVVNLVIAPIFLAVCVLCLLPYFLYSQCVESAAIERASSERISDIVLHSKAQKGIGGINNPKNYNIQQNQAVNGNTPVLVQPLLSHNSADEEQMVSSITGDSAYRQLQQVPTSYSGNLLPNHQESNQLVVGGGGKNTLGGSFFVEGADHSNDKGANLPNFGGAATELIPNDRSQQIQMQQQLEGSEGGRAAEGMMSLRQASLFAHSEVKTKQPK